MQPLLNLKISGIEIANCGFYINLDTSTERRENVEVQIKNYNIENLNRFPALTDEARHYSCTKSHLKVFEISEEHKLEIILVLEDDFQIRDKCYIKNIEYDFTETLKNLMDELQYIEWDVVLLGGTPRTYLIPVSNLLSINYKSTGGWAYLIKRKAYNHILKNSNYFRDYLAIDDMLPLLNNFGFKSLISTPKLISHATGFISTLQPNGVVNYDTMIDGSYDGYLYNHIDSKNFFINYKFEREVTIVIVGHFVTNFILYLRYLLHSLPQSLEKCKFLIIYDTNNDSVDHIFIRELQDYFKNRNKIITYEILYSKGGLVDSVKLMLEKLTTKYFIFLEHDWVFLKNKEIDLRGLLDTFEKYKFVNAVWFNKDDNQLRGFDIARDVEGTETPFDKEHRITDFELTTTVRWSNNPSMLRTSKYREWFDKYIYNDGIGKNHQGQYNVEDNMIREYRDLISKTKYEDIKDDWGTYLYGAVGTGPYVGHTDGSRRYQTTIRTIAEDNADEYMNSNILPIND